jgi:hypothetical protein
MNTIPKPFVDHSLPHIQASKHPIQFLCLRRLRRKRRPTALLPLLPLSAIHKPLLLRLQPVIHILRLEDMHPAIQPTRRNPPPLRQILSCPALLKLFQCLPRLGFEFGQVLLQRRAAAQDLIWVRCLPARRLDVLWRFVGVGLICLEDRGREGGGGCDVGVWQWYAVWKREEGRHGQRHLCQQRMWVWEQSVEEDIMRLVCNLRSSCIIRTSNYI